MNKENIPGVSNTKKLLTLKQVKLLNPYKEDEFYTIRKQVDLIREKSKENNKADLKKYRLGDFILFAGAILTLLLFTGPERLIIAGAMIGFMLLSQLLPSRKKQSSFNKLKRYLLAKVAVGDVVHGPYKITLNANAESELRFQGMTSAIETVLPKTVKIPLQERNSMSDDELLAYEENYKCTHPEGESCPDCRKGDEYLILVVRDDNESAYSTVINVTGM